VDGEVALLSALISGRRKTTDISMPRSTRKKWGMILESQGHIRRFIDQGERFYELTKEGLHYAILEHGLTPAAATYVLPAADDEEPAPKFVLPTAPLRRKRRWVAVGKMLVLIIFVGSCGYALGRYDLGGLTAWLHSTFSGIR
jgi:hypothetical protein